MPGVSACGTCRLGSELAEVQRVGVSVIRRRFRTCVLRRVRESIKGGDVTERLQGGRAEAERHVDDQESVRRGRGFGKRKNCP